MEKTANLFHSVYDINLDEIARSINENNINLSKEEYFHFRKQILSKYERDISEKLGSGEVDKEKVSRINKILTDFTRYQHSKLFKEELQEKRRAKGYIETDFDFEDASKNSYVETIRDTKVNEEYSNNWRKADDVLYALERKAWRKDILENRGISVEKGNEEEAFRALDKKNGDYAHIEKTEEELMEMVPTNYLSKYKLKTLDMIKNKISNSKKLFYVLNKHRKRVTA